MKFQFRNPQQQNFERVFPADQSMADGGLEVHELNTGEAPKWLTLHMA